LTGDPIPFTGFDNDEKIFLFFFSESSQNRKKEYPGIQSVLPTPDIGKAFSSNEIRAEIKQVDFLESS